MAAAMSEAQQAICARHKARFTPPAQGESLGAALPLTLGAPVHGQRHPPEPGTSGWYVWTGAGDLADGEFRDVPVETAGEIDPRLVKYLALPPGWRFTLGADREEAWFDPSLFEVSANDD
jgi:hypothetical protein